MTALALEVTLVLENLLLTMLSAHVIPESHASLRSPNCCIYLHALKYLPPTSVLKKIFYISTSVVENDLSVGSPIFLAILEIDAPSLAVIKDNLV